MNSTIVRLSTQALLGRRRGLVLALIPAVVIALAVVIRALTEPGTGYEIVDAIGFTLALPLVALLASSAVLGPEIDDGSIVYLLSKPLSRHSIAGTKAAVAASVVTVFAAVPVLVAGLVLAGTSNGLAAGYFLGALVAGLAYATLFLLLAVVTRHAVVIGLIYALIWESLVGSYVPGAQALSIQQWSLALSAKVVGAKAEALGVTSAVSLGAAVPLLVVLAVGSTWYAGRRLRSLRLTSDE
jgi:ABC-2 type transport system permease protein